MRRAGGHITALRVHHGSAVFARRDIKDFFPSVTRTKVARALRRIGFSHKYAFDVASESVVVEVGRHIVPYGFVQSMLLATLVLEMSLLGSVLRAAEKFRVRVSVYVDDIIISGAAEADVLAYLNALDFAADQSGFHFNNAKSSSVEVSLAAFNIELTSEELHITHARMELLRATAAAGGNVAAGVAKYVQAVNRDQVAEL